MPRPSPAAKFSTRAAGVAKRLSDTTAKVAGSYGVSDSTKVVKASVAKPKLDPETYSESARGIKITAERAIREVQKHHGDVEAFLKETGNKSHYMANKVLEWLGY